MTNPRRWPHFSLRALFVMVTLASIAASWFAWYRHQPTVRVIGTLTRSDFAEIRHLIRQTRDLRSATNVIIVVQTPGDVEVETRIDTDGWDSGHMTQLKKAADGWTIASMARWSE